MDHRELPPQYAQAVVRADSQVNELPQGVRGAITNAAEGAWTSWLLKGQPTRQAALARCVVELKHDPSRTGTLEQRQAPHESWLGGPTSGRVAQVLEVHQVHQLACSQGRTRAPPATIYTLAVDARRKVGRF